MINKAIISIGFLLLVAILISFPTSARAQCEVTLQWDANTEPNVAGYRFYMRVEGGAYDYSWFEWQGSETQYTVTALDEDTVYYFVVRAFDDQGNESGDSNEVRFAYAATTPPDSSSPPDSSPGLDNGTGGTIADSLHTSNSSGGCFIGSLF